FGRTVFVRCPTRTAHRPARGGRGGDRARAAGVDAGPPAYADTSASRGGCGGRGVRREVPRVCADAGVRAAGRRASFASRAADGRPTRGDSRAARAAEAVWRSYAGAFP